MSLSPAGRERGREGERERGGGREREREEGEGEREGGGGEREREREGGRKEIGEKKYNLHSLACERGLIVCIAI